MSDRSKLSEQVAVLCAGHPVGDVLYVLADRLSEIAGFASKSPEEAEVLLRKLVPDMVHTIRVNWPGIREAQLRANLAGGA